MKTEEFMDNDHELGKAIMPVAVNIPDNNAEGILKRINLTSQAIKSWNKESVLLSFLF